MTFLSKNSIVKFQVKIILYIMLCSCDLCDEVTCVCDWQPGQTSTSLHSFRYAGVSNLKTRSIIYYKCSEQQTG